VNVGKQFVVDECRAYRDHNSHYDVHDNEKDFNQLEGLGLSISDL
jgi:hypothetical protein